MTGRFDPDLRERRQDAFAIGRTSTAPGTIPLELAGRRVRVYANANLSIYSAAPCNARCSFCVEELRPAARGTTLSAQKAIEPDDERYMEHLERALRALAPLDPSVSITGGEPTKDPRLPRILATLARAGARKRTLTTNGSGLLDRAPAGGVVLDHVIASGLEHLNLSRADPDESANQRVMRVVPPFSNADLARALAAIRAARPRAPRPRLSCVLLRGRTFDLASSIRYLDWAASLGVDNVVFRELMKFDRASVLEGPVTRFADAHRAPLRPILEAIRPSEPGRAGHRDFTFLRQVVGYYYYVEVYRYAPRGARTAVDVVFEEADLAWIERRRLLAGEADLVHELVFHPDGRLCSSWQPWDGVLLEPGRAPAPPPSRAARERRADADLALL